MRIIANIKESTADSSGFTLIEALVAIGILTFAVAIIGSGMFQVFNFQQFWQADVVATKELRHAGSWFAGDALNAEDVLDAGGVTQLTCNPDPAAEQVTLQWTDKDGVTQHSATYSLSGAKLIRNYDGDLNTMARPVVAGSLDFTLCGNLLTLKMQVEADRSTNEDITLQTYIRRLQP
ncbi:MAG: prepilin-type N-terminal cleavage/methylation domain-containing protein [Chloroflexi bacterium]|nr:prepilin-type N-terminal cleavage/methylation domain-containing protein [Chloroflexota bacterium]